MDAGDKERPRESKASSQVGNLEQPATTRKKPDHLRQPPGQWEGKEDVVTWRRDAKRMTRASNKIASDLLRSTRDQARAEKQEPEKKNMKIYVTLHDRVGLPFLKHWNATRRELHVGIDKGPWEIRKCLIRVYRLKGLPWVLYRRDLREGRWAELPKLPKSRKKGTNTGLKSLEEREGNRMRQGRVRGATTIGLIQGRPSEISSGTPLIRESIPKPKCDWQLQNVSATGRKIQKSRRTSGYVER
jgi:hypothetical protein